MPSNLKDTGSIPSGPQSRAAAALIQQYFPEIAKNGPIGGSRDNNTAKNTHDTGTSIDIPVSMYSQGALGDRIRDFFQNPEIAQALGVQYTIWRNKGEQTGLAGRPKGTFNQPGHDTHIDVHFGGKPGALPAALDPNAPAATTAATTPLPVTLPTNTNQALIATADNTSNLPLMPQAISNLAANDPDLSKAIAASQSGIGQDEAVPLLQHLDGLIADQNKLGTPDGKKMADALGNTRSQLMQQTGLKEGPDMLGTAQSIASGVSGLASSIFEAVDAGLKSVAATKDLGDLAVRGIENTESINKIIDNVQVYIDFAAKIGSAVTQGLQLAADIAGAAQAAGGGPAGGDAGGAAVGALQTAAGIAGIVTQVIQAVNTAIDIGQEAYKIGTKYLGRALTTFLGFPGASDIHYLLDTVTGQLNAYTSDNPLMKHQFNTISRELRNNQGDVRPAPNNSFVIYQGPGQDPRDTMDDAMFTIRSSGVGAFGYAV
jgi:hypothetical protein